MVFNQNWCLAANQTSITNFFSSFKTEVKFYQQVFILKYFSNVESLPLMYSLRLNKHKENISLAYHERINSNDTVAIVSFSIDK